jgi:hypothetical protein
VFPAATAVTTPVDELIVATLGVALVHIPPEGVLDNVVVAVEHIVVVPVIAVTVGSGFTVNVTTGEVADTHVPLVTIAL